MNQGYEFQSSKHQDQEHQNGFGPYLQQKPILEYQKRQSSMISNPPESLDATNRNTENPLIKNIKLKHLKKEDSFRKFKTKQTQYSSQITHKKTNLKNSAENQLTESMQIMRNQITNLISKLVRIRYIKQFKSNIFLNSYVLPQNHKDLLLEELYLQENEKQSKQKNMQQKSQNILYPGSRVILIIDSIIILIQLLSLWFGPLISFFQNIFDQTQVLSLIIFLTHLAEIFISMNRAIIISGETIQDRKQIIQSYVQSKFYYDLIMIIVWLLYCLKFNQEYIINELMVISSSLVNMKKLAQNYYNYIEYFYQKKGINNFIDLITLIILIFFYAHFMACLWHYIGNLQNIYDMTWLIKYNLIDLSMWTKYFYSFYWSTVTIATIGYGDITPQNNIEIIFCSIMILFSSCVYAYLMNSIGIILKQLNDTKFKYRMQTSLISQYMNNNQVNQNIQSRVKSFLQFNLKNEQSEDQDVDLLISQLPETLKTEMLEEIQTLLINKIQLLKSNFSKDLIIKLSKKVNRLKFPPGDLIVKQNGLQNNKLYFIIEGKVNLVEENSKKVFQTVNAYQCFNEYSFFTGFAPKFSARSLEYTEIIIIDRNEMIEQLVGLQKDRERFHMIKDQILLENCYVQIQLKCFFCGKYNHQSIDCKMIQYKPDIEQLQKKMYFNSRQERGQFKRMKDKGNSLAFQRNVYESIFKFNQERMESNQEEFCQTLNSKMKSSQIHNQPSTNKIINLENFEQQLRQKKRNHNTQQLDENRINQPLFAKYEKILKTFSNINLELGSLLELQMPNQIFSLAKCEESQLEEFMIPQLFHSTIIDLGRNYRYYYPKQNSQEVIRQYNNLLFKKTWLNCEEKLKHYSSYTYNFNQLQKIVLCKKS